MKIDIRTFVTRNFLVKTGETYTACDRTYGDMVKLCADVILSKPETKEIRRLRKGWKPLCLDSISASWWSEQETSFRTQIEQEPEKYWRIATGPGVTPHTIEE